ncbi:hypothetical protein ACTPEM_24610, partial [Clostridioides difficile]
ENALYNMNLMVSPFTAEIVHRLLYSPIIDKIIEEKRDAIIESCSSIRLFHIRCISPIETV